MLRACLSLVLSFVLGFLLVPSAGAAGGQAAYLVRDIAGGEVLQGLQVNGPFHPLGKKVIFQASDRLNGAELWVSDGTPHGTELLADVCIGSCGSNSKILGVHGGRIYWAAIPSGAPVESPWQLWASDGTRAGTHSLTDPGLTEVEADLPGYFAFAGRHLYFGACDQGTADCALWRSDGTPEGTAAIEAQGDGHARPQSLLGVGDRVYFTDIGPQSAGRLWIAGGAGGVGGIPSSPVLLRTFGTFSLPTHLAAAGNRAFFAADTSEGTELWTSDGTPAGTRAITRFAITAPFPTFSNDPKKDWFLKPAGNLVYFLAYDQDYDGDVWRSDGTPEGTFRVTNFQRLLDPFRPHLESPGRFQTIGNRFLFQVSDEEGPGAQWWSSAGTAATTRSFQDECPSCQFPSLDSDLFSGNGRLLFVGTRPGASRGEVWTSDGTAAGTKPIPDPCTGLCGSLFNQIVPSSGGVFYRVVGEGGGTPLDLWFTDGTPAGTKRLTRVGKSDTAVEESPAARTSDGKFLFPVTQPAEEGQQLWVSDGTPESGRPILTLGRRPGSSSPRDLNALGERLFFLACAPGDQVWQTSGSAGNTSPVIGLSQGLCEVAGTAIGLTTAGSSAFFFSRAGSEGFQLWKTDGTAGGTVRLTSFLPDTEAQPLSGFAFRGQLYFQVETRQPRKFEIWRSDGTPQGTVKAFELPGQFPHRLEVLGDEMYFLTAHFDGAFWRSDGTQNGTVKIGTAEHIVNPEGAAFVRLGNDVYFGSSDLEGHPEIWRTDGTSINTRALATLPEWAGVLPWDLTVHQGALYFFAAQGAHHGLWRSDGTQGGTVLVRSFDGYKPLEGNRLTSFGSALFFVAKDAEHGVELWRSDGTAAGTALLRDIRPGGGSSYPRSLTAAGGRLFFVATDVAHGTELWETDGTAAGTRLVHDIAPLARSSSPAELTVAGDRLYFAADDDLTGRELWAYPLSGSGDCQTSPTRLCLGGGRFQVEASWRDFQGNAGTGQAVSLTADTGYFWFFDPANVETIVKVLDGQGLNGHHWVFYGALSSVEYTLTVTDLQTGLTRRYLNPSGVFASVGDTQGFGPQGAFSRAPSDVVASPGPAVVAEERTDPAAATGSCEASARRLCLQGGRFAVEVSWKDFQNRTGEGRAVSLTSDTGYFWFFDAANVEVVAKVLDGSALNGKFWFFYGALSNVEYRITVTDTATGKVRTYSNPAGRFASVGDTGAF